MLDSYMKAFTKDSTVSAKLAVVCQKCTCFGFSCQLRDFLYFQVPLVADLRGLKIYVKIRPLPSIEMINSKELTGLLLNSTSTNIVRYPTSIEYDFGSHKVLYFF